MTAMCRTEADCCARAASGHVIAAPLIRLINSRRFIAPRHNVQDKLSIAVFAYVRFGSKADVRTAKSHVRSYSETGHVQCKRSCPLSAKSGHSDIHSISASAPCCMPNGTSRPSDFAVLRLMIRSNLVGACTGRSSGLAPLRMRSTYVAAWGNCSAKSLA